MPKVKSKPELDLEPEPEPSCTEHLKFGLDARRNSCKAEQGREEEGPPPGISKAYWKLQQEKYLRPPSPSKFYRCFDAGRISSSSGLCYNEFISPHFSSSSDPTSKPLKSRAPRSRNFVARGPTTSPTMPSISSSTGRKFRKRGSLRASGVKWCTDGVKSMTSSLRT